MANKIDFDMVYHLYGSDGSHELVGQDKLSQQSELNLAAAAVSNGTKTVTQNEDGSYNLESAVKFTLDKDTGKITVTAPKFFTDRDIYKDKIKPQLESLSSAYKTDPDYKFASSTDDKTEYSVEDYLKKMNQDFGDSETLKQFQEIDKETKTRRTQGYDDWTDKESEISLYGNNNLLKNAKDDDRVYVADFGEVNFFQNASSYDEATGTISYSDFKKVFSRKENSDEDVLEKYGRMLQTTTEGGLGKDSGMSAAQYARLQAAYRLAKGTSPDVGIIEGAWDQVTGAAMGLANGIEGFTYGLLDAVGLDVMGLYSGWESIYETDTERREILNNNSIAIKSVADFATLFIPISIVGNAAKGARAGVKALRVAKVAKNTKKVAEATKVLKQGGRLASLAAKIDGVTAESVAAGVKISMQAAKAADVSESTLKAIKTYNAAQTALKTTAGLSKAATLGLNIATFGAESVLTTILIEPELLKKAIAGDKDGEVTKELWTQLAIDSAMLGGVKGLSKGVKEFSKTTIGSAMNVNASIRMAKLETLATNVRNGVKGVLIKGDNADRALKLIKEGEATQDAAKQTKGLTIAANEIISQGKAEFAKTDKVKWLGKDKEAIQEQVRKANEVRVTKVEAKQIAVDRYQRNIDAEIRNTFLATPQIGKAYDNMTSAFAKLVKADTIKNKSMGKAMTAGGVVKLVSQDTANYLGGKYTAAFYTRKAEIVGSLSEAEKKSLAEAEEMVKKFDETAAPGLKKMADDFYETQQRLYKELTSYFAEKGIFSQSEIDAKRASGLWGVEGEEYIRQQRIKARRGAFISNKKNIKGELQEMQAGTGDFADPMVVFSDWIAKNCDKLNRQNVIRMLTGSEDIILVDATKTMAARQASRAAQKRFNQQTSKAIKEVIEGMSSRSVYKGVFLGGVGKAKMLKQETAIEKAGKNLSRTEKKTFSKSSVSERSVYISELSDDQLSQLSNEFLGYNTPTEYMEQLAGGEVIAEGVEGIGYTRNEVFDYWLSSLDKKDIKTLEDSMTVYLETEGRTIGKDEKVLTYDNYIRLTENDPLFERTITADILSNNPKYRDSETVRNMIAEEKRNYELFRAQHSLKEERQALDDVMREYGVGEGYREGATYDFVIEKIDDEIDNAVKTILKTDNGEVIKGVLTATKSSGEVAEAYIGTRALREHKKEFLDAVKAQAKKEIKELSGKGTKLSEATQNRFAKAVSDITEFELDEKFGKLHQKLTEIKSPLADQKYLFGEVAELRKEVEKTIDRAKDTSSGIVPLGTKNGEVEYVDVGPLVATIAQDNNAYARSHMGAISNMLYMQSKLFRLGTTGLRLKSWLMQTSRDGIALYSGIGQLHTLGNCADNLVDVFGKDIIREFQSYDARTYTKVVEDLRADEKFMKLSEEEQQREIARTLIEGELQRGYARSTTATQTEAYRVRRVAGRSLYDMGVDQSKLDAFSAGLDSLMRAKYVKGTKVPNPLHMNEWREDYMRRMAYANSYRQSIEAGYGVANSRIHAEFLMNNATTNFSRLPVHLSGLHKTVPYLGSAINGTKSFYRMMSLDPLGVMGRLIGGIAIPAMAVTAFSLSNEENREIYKNIPEYEKEDNLVFVVDGQVVTVPLPQEMSSIFAPFRHFMEGLYDVDNHKFWELAANTVIGVSPIDFSGFLALDRNNLQGDPTWNERFTTGISKLVAQMSPPVIKTGIMLATNKDPYTGRDVDTSYVYTDPETGETWVVDYKSGQFGKWCASIFGDHVSAATFETIFSNLLGNTGMNFLDDLASWAQGVPAANYTQEAAGAFNAKLYDRAESAWSAAMRELNNQKDAIVNSEEYKSIQQKIGLSEGEAREKLYEELNDMLTPLYENTKTAVDNLIDQYGGQYTARKFAAVLALLNTSTGGGSAALTQRGVDVRSEDYYNGKNAAVETMWKMGFRSTNDSSIFGYVKKGGDGEYEIVYRDPLSILAYDNASISQNDIHQSNIEALLKSKEISTISSASYNDPEYAKAKAAGKDAFNEYKAKQNQKVVEALIPYVERYGVEAVVKSSSMVDFLDNYIYVKNAYKAKDYIKSLFEEED